MHEMTAGNLRSAFGGESMAHMRYMIWGRKAVSEGFHNVGRLFEAVAFAEQAHAGGHFNVLARCGGGFAVTSMAGFGQESTSQNLAGAIEGENFEVAEMYPAYITVAQGQDEKSALRSFTWAFEAEKVHAELYARAKAAVDAGKDVQIGAIHVCVICGHTAEGDLPEKCPLCGAKKEKYKTFA